MKIRTSLNDKKSLAQMKSNKDDNTKITMMGKIIPRATDLKNGKMHNAIYLDISRENPVSLFEETINKLEIYNLNQQNKFESRSRNNLNLYAEQESELKSKAIFDFNSNPNAENKKVIYRNSSITKNINKNKDQNNQDQIEMENNYNPNPNAQESANHSNNKYNDVNNLNSNLDGSFGFSRNSVLTSNNMPLNLHNRMVSDNSNFNLNELADKNNKEVYLHKQSGVSENNIFLNNLNKNNIINNNNTSSSSRNDFFKDERILSFLFSVIDSKSSFTIFRKFNLNFYDFLNVTKDELTEFKIPIKEKIRVLKLNLNLKKFLEENINETDFTAFTQNTAEVNNFNLIFEFFKQNKFLVYNQKFLDGFLTENKCFANNTQDQDPNNSHNYNSNENGEFNNPSTNSNCNLDYNPNTDDDKNLESHYVTTPNFRNVSYRKNNANSLINNALCNVNSNRSNLNIENFKNINNCNNDNFNENMNNTNFIHKPNNTKIYDNYKNNSNKTVFYHSNKNIDNSTNNNKMTKGNQHEKEIIELLKNKEIKSNAIGPEPAYAAKKLSFKPTNRVINKNKQNENSPYESFRNECEKIKDLNENYKDVYSNANSLIGNKHSEFGNDPHSESFMFNRYLCQNSNLFSESGNAFANKHKCAADNSSINFNNYGESNKDNTSFKISNFSIKSKNNLNTNKNENLNQNDYTSNSNIDNEEYEYNNAEQDQNDEIENFYNSNNNNNNSNLIIDQNPEKPKNNKVRGWNKENLISDKIKNHEVLENHENLQKQKKLLDKVIESKTKSKIKFKKNSTRYINNSNEIGKVVDNYLSEYKELKQRSEDRQMKFNRLLKNCNRMQNNNNNINKNKTKLDSAYYIEDGENNEKTNTEDREELFLNKELNDLLIELQIYSDNFRVSDENIYKLKRIKEIIDTLKAKNNNFEFDLDFNVEELEQQLELEKIEKAEQRKLNIAEEIKKCNFNINEKKKILDILEQDSVRNKNKSNLLLNRIKQINSNNSFKNNLSQQSKPITTNNESSKYHSEKTNSLNNKEVSDLNEDQYDYENEDLNQHVEQSSYEEYYDSKNYSIHNFQKDN